MEYTLEILNFDASLNEFIVQRTAVFFGGADSLINFRLIRADRKTRYIFPEDTIFEVSLLKSDDTTLNKVLTQPFADDRSMLQLALTDVETEALVSQNIKVKITDPDDNIYFAFLQSALQRKFTSNQEC